MKPRRIYVGGVGYGEGNIGDDGVLEAVSLKLPCPMLKSLSEHMKAKG